MIYVECKRHLVLVQSLTGVSRREVRHEGGKDNVCNRLRRKTDCTGLVDEDPSSTQSPYLREAEVQEDLPGEGIRVLRHRRTNNRLILLCPTSHDWILAAARAASVNMVAYNLPNNARALHRVINVSIDRFERLLDTLKGCSRLEALRRLLLESM